MGKKSHIEFEYDEWENDRYDRKREKTRSSVKEAKRAKQEQRNSFYATDSNFDSRFSYDDEF